MDSHLYFKKDKLHISYNLIDEILYTKGVSSVLWHQRVFAYDYNWGYEYKKILKYYYSKCS